VIPDERTLRLLQIDDILTELAGRCRSDMGVASFADLRPASDSVEVRRRQELLRAYGRRTDRKGPLPWDARAGSLLPLLQDAREAAILTGEELLRARRLLMLAARMREALESDREECPEFAPWIRGLRDFSEELRELAVLDDEGRLYDRASPELARIRRRIEERLRQIRSRAQAVLNDPQFGPILQEKVLSLRGGRFALLVRQDAIGSFPGIVLERSGSGASVYMEPASLVPLNNELALLRDEEREEERRILRLLTEMLVRREPAIREAEEELGEIDRCYALREVEAEKRWHLPELVDEPRFDLHRVRHPLLGDRAVPIDIRCGGRFRGLVVTGPNTGGKTVALKTAGVAVHLALCGLPVPAAEGSLVGWIAGLYGDIGDEQSLEQNLSTFSAHIVNIVRILREAPSDSLILLDELGAGTDPDEGAALGIALLEALRARKCLVLATTHHNVVKRHALETEGIETASVEFDAATLSPTYRLLIGIPGRSNALRIAERLGMPEEILARAREALGFRESSMEDLIGELQEKRTALDREMRETESLRKRAERLAEDYGRRLEEWEKRRDRMLADAEGKAVRIVREAEDAAKALLKKMEGVGEAAARRELEAKKKHFAGIERRRERREEEQWRREVARTPGKPEVGSRVEIVGAGVKGEVERIEGEQAEVVAGSARIRVPLARLRRLVDEPPDMTPTVRIRVSSPGQVPSSLMVRGMTVDEAIPAVEHYLDQAYRAGYGEVAVIHGRGEGILRREVTELCKRVPYVEEYRLGGVGEGGYGVTIVRFRR